MHKCEVCRLIFKTKSGLQGHLLSKQHQNRSKSPDLLETKSPQTPKKRKTCMIELEAESLEVPVLESPGKWLPQPKPKPCETPKKVKKKCKNRGSVRRKHWSYGEQAPVTLPILLSWFIVCMSDDSQCIADQDMFLLLLVIPVIPESPCQSC